MYIDLFRCVYSKIYEMPRMGEASAELMHSRFVLTVEAVDNQALVTLPADASPQHS